MLDCSDNLYGTIEKMVFNGEISWEDVLEEVKDIKLATQRQKFDYILSTYQTDVITLHPSQYNSTSSDPTELNILENTPSATFSPLDLCLRKDLYETLPEKPRLLAKAILNATPYDFREGKIGQYIFAYNQRKKCYDIKRSKVIELMRDWGWNYREIAKVFKTLRNYCKEIDAVIY